MLAKVITLAHSRPGHGFGPALRYVLRVDRHRELPLEGGPESGHLHLVREPFCSAADDPRAYAQDLTQLFDDQMRRCRQRGRFRGNPVYHVAITWKAGEHPTRQQIERASRRVMQTLGFEACQALWSLHRDTDNDHVHLLINRIHPTKFTAIEVPRRDYWLLDRCMRELELELGFSRAHGPYVTVDAAEGPKIVRMSRAERDARGLLRNDSSPRISVRAQRAEHNLAATSFQRWITDAPSEALHRAIRTPGATWQDAHRALAGFGCVIQPKGSGLVVTTTLSSGRVLAAKASQMGRWAAKTALERVLGSYAAPEQTPRLVRPHQHYEHFLERERHTEGRPRQVHGDGQRLARRAGRAEARRQLAERFAREQAQLQARRRMEREALRRRHEGERRALAATHRAQRQRLGPTPRARRLDAHLGLALWAFAAAREREALQHRQAAERRALTDRLPRGEVWRRWLERQAAAGDRAAQAALRGIQYRARRREREDALAGEDIAALRPFTVGALRAEVDAVHRIVVYRRADGTEVFRDTGQRLLMQDRSDASVEAALRIAAQKYGGRVQVTGSDRFRERTARMATRMGIAVVDVDLQMMVAEERRWLEERGMGSREASGSTPSRRRDRGSDRSRGTERG